MRTLRLLSFLGGLICLVAAGSARAGDASELTEVLRLDEVIGVLRNEGIGFGEELNRDMLGGLGGAFWTEQVAQIYDPGRMRDALRMALAQGMDGDQIAASLRFFETELGQRILSLETSARKAMADPEVEQVARDTYGALKGTSDERLAIIARFIEVNDLLERNVASTLGASFYFMRGLVDGGASDMDEDQMTAEVWSQEDETRADTESWLYGFLLLAYRPLSDEDIEAYIAYSETPAGQALNSALFNGFDGMYLAISHALGVLVAEATASSDL